MALIGGFLLLVIIGWLGVDAVVSGTGRTPWLALAAMILVVPLVVAFTLRPAVFANDDRLRIRNPFRVIVIPWGQVETFRSGYSNEVLVESGTKYQLWAIPVSLRGRKKAARQAARQAARPSDTRRPGRGLGLLGGGMQADAFGGRTSVPEGPCGPRPTGSWTNCARGWRPGGRRRPRRARFPCGGRTRSWDRRWRVRCSWRFWRLWGNGFRDAGG